MMRRIAFLLFVMVVAAPAEIHTLTLRQAVDRALQQNPDLIMARLDEQRAVEQVRVARDPFIPKVFVGSGLAYSNGFPMSIEGSAPSIVQAKGIASVFNRPERHRLQQTKEEARGATLDTQMTRDQIVMRTVELYLQAENAAKTVRMVQSQTEGLEKVAQVMEVRVAEGRELPIEVKRAALDLARARQRVEVFESEQVYAESRLASVLGFEPGDQVRTGPEDRQRPELPDSEDAAVASAMEDNIEVRKLESSLIAKGFQLKAAKTEGLPRVNLVAQYGLFSKFNNYEEYFNRFERHNGQIGVSLELPLYAGPASKARRAQAEIESDRLRTELASTRSRIALDARKAFQDLKKSQTATEVARLDLDLVREELGVLLARMEEGRVSLKEVEAARYLENEKWIAYYDARHSLELARYRLLENTGGLVAAVTR